MKRNNTMVKLEGTMAKVDYGIWWWKATVWYWIGTVHLWRRVVSTHCTIILSWSFCHHLTADLQHRTVMIILSPSYCRSSPSYCRSSPSYCRSSPSYCHDHTVTILLPIFNIVLSWSFCHHRTADLHHCTVNLHAHTDELHHRTVALHHHSVDLHKCHRVAKRLVLNTYTFMVLLQLGGYKSLSSSWKNIKWKNKWKQPEWMTIIVMSVCIYYVNFENGIYKTITAHYNICLLSLYGMW